MGGDTERLPRVDEAWTDAELNGPHTPSWYARRVLRTLALGCGLVLAAVVGAVVTLTAFLVGRLIG